MLTEVERLRGALERICVLADPGQYSDRSEEIFATATAALAQPQPTLDTRPVLTPRQAEVLSCIKQYQRERGYAPTVRDIGARLGIGSPNGVMCHLKVLERLGYLLRDSNVARAITLVEAS